MATASFATWLAIWIFRLRPEPSIVFNYLGQLDQVVAASSVFRIASASADCWHSPKQRRRYALELNSLVIGGRLELRCTFGEALHSEAEIQRLADEFLTASRELISHCLSPGAGGRTPSDFPLAQLDQATVDRLVDGCPDLEDVYPLAPIQALFYSASPGTISTAFDQWHGTLKGELNVAAFQAAWHQTLQRHSILRSTFHGDGLREPLQVVHRDIEAPWTVQDWRGVPDTDRLDRWHTFLRQDRSTPLDLSKAPVMRFALLQIADDQWKFLWSVPALLLDGWSWPIVFGEASRLYGALCERNVAQLELARPYRDYVAWLSRQSKDDALQFWQKELAGFVAPTPLPAQSGVATSEGERYAERTIQFSPDSTESLQLAARRLRVTVEYRSCRRHGRCCSTARVGRQISSLGRHLPAGQPIYPALNRLSVRL